MGLLDEFFKSPEQENERRAREAGLREAREGGPVENLLNDIADEVSWGRDCVDRKIPTREGARTKDRSTRENLSSDTYDEVAHRPEYVARKTYYREVARDSPAEESSSCGGGGGMGGVGSDAGGSFWLVVLIVIGSIILVPFYIAEKIKERFWPEPPQGLAVAVYEEKGKQPARFLEYKSGHAQTVRLSVTWEGRGTYMPVTLSLLQDKTLVYTKNFKTVEIEANEVLVPYMPRRPGYFVARVATEGQPAHEYEFAVGTYREIGGIVRRDSQAAPERALGLGLYVTDSYFGPLPGPPKNVIYVVRDEPKWLYAVVASDASAVSRSVDVVVVCGRVPIARATLQLRPNSRQWITLHEKLEANHCGEIVLASGNPDITFPFIIVEVERGKSGGDYRTISDPDVGSQNMDSPWLRSGIEFSKAGQHEMAVREFSKAATDDNDGAAHNLRGNEYFVLGDYERAIADYNYVLRWRPHDRWARNNRGAAYGSLGDYPRAIADFEYELLVDPSDQFATQGLARAHQEMARQGMAN